MIDRTEMIAITQLVLTTALPYLREQDKARFMAEMMVKLSDLWPKTAKEQGK